MDDGYCECNASTSTNVQNPKIFSEAILNNIKTKINSLSVREDAIAHSKKYALEKMCYEYSLIYKKYIRNS